MKVTQLINNYMRKIPYNEPFTNVELLKFGSRANIDQILSRLVKTKKITRVTRGIFVKNKTNTCSGKIMPTPAKIAETIAKNSGEIIIPNGAEAARQLQLSTQVPTRPIFLTNGSNRKVTIGKMKIIFKHVSQRKIALAGTTAGSVISALWYLGEQQVNEHVIDQIKNKLSLEQFNSVLTSVSFMPIWMANIFYHYKNR